jgi:citrate synthase
VDEVKARLGAARLEAHRVLGTLGNALDAEDAMDALRASVAHLAERATNGERPRWASAADVTGAVAVFATTWARRRAHEPVVEPDPELGHSADYLRLLRGEPAAPHEIDALDAYLVTVMDHGLNASTFAARVVASTGSDLVSAVTAAIGALKGPLHGGAPGPVLDMLDAISSPSEARDWLGHEIDARRRIMGMGHRVYRVRDPRASVLETAVERVREAVATQEAGDGERVARRLALARAVEREATALLAARHPNRALRANVEFYTAVLLEAIGVPRELFSATFAAARTVGWTAHIDEQRRKGRLIRPSSVYVGPMPDGPMQSKSA